ncbi:YecA family protein [Azorhizobium doebereinerae]|uniref:YecA family protein n=1 Tax=Azorhizobium doebereinerae TaxID=281091 RepID=UPI000A071210|nr:SEC-C domain-containing protein [Azorhizobium doebereinerae]
MIKEPKRNDPCWCGSGVKFKKCHRARDVQPKENAWDAVDANRKAFSVKKCCAHDVGLGACQGSVIKAHTVSKGPNLSKIAKNGHVMQYVASIPEMKKNGGKLIAKKLGINDASIFHGFCGGHDRDLFSCIENEEFSGRPDQCLAVAYRTMSRELYGKDASAHLRETLRGADKGLTAFDQFIIQNMLDGFNEGNEAARREFKHTHDALTSALVAKRFEDISSIIFEFDAPLPFMFAGAWSPFTDIHGRELQKGHPDELLEQIFVSSFAGKSSAMICISWRSVENAPGQIIAGQLKELPDSRLASICLQFAMKHIENVFFNPDWFQYLDRKHKEHLNKLAADTIYELGGVPSVSLKMELDFQLPPSARSFEVHPRHSNVVEASPVQSP